MTDPGDVAESKIVAETCVEIVRAFLSYELDTQAHFMLRPLMTFMALLSLGDNVRAERMKWLEKIWVALE